MDYEQVVEQHLAWPHELRAYVDKPDGSFRAADIQSADACGLGQWLRTRGVRYGALSEYSALLRAHGELHQVTADIIRHADAGTLVATALDDQSDFKKSFIHFLSALLAFRQHSGE
jgi:hypothetical protein